LSLFLLALGEVGGEEKGVCAFALEGALAMEFKELSSQKNDLVTVIHVCIFFQLAQLLHYCPLKQCFSTSNIL
jgi:hypothetical protein